MAHVFFVTYDVLVGLAGRVELLEHDPRLLRLERFYGTSGAGTGDGDVGEVPVVDALGTSTAVAGLHVPCRDLDGVGRLTGRYVR